MTRRSAWVPRFAVVALASLSCSAATAHAQEQPWRDRTLPPDERAELLAGAMTLDQKLRLLEANPSTPSPELGIPSRKEKDGCCGVQLAPATEVPTTGLPTGVSLASTFSRALAEAYGAQEGEELWHVGYAGLTSPNSDLADNPWFGRQAESMGEDPLLSGRLAASVVRGIQRQPGVYAIPKHYLLNLQETQRYTVDQRIDRRGLRELHARAWEIIVRQGDPGAVMCAFNRVNGDPACASEPLLRDILKTEWGFPGWVVSDFNACPDESAFTRGTDICAPDIATPENLRAAVESGAIPPARLDDIVHRVLRTFFARGVIDNPPPGSLQTPSVDQPSGPAPDELLDRGEQLARTIAAHGTVLLKNARRTLPLTGGIDSIAVIGIDADHHVDMLGSPSVPNPARLTTTLDGIREAAGPAIAVRHAPGGDPGRYGDMLGGPAPVPSGVLRPEGGGDDARGLTARYYFGTEGPAGEPFASRTEDQVNFLTGLATLLQSFGTDTSRAPGLPFPVALQPITAVWSGTLNPTVTGTYRLGFRGMGSFRLWLDGALILDAFEGFPDHELVPVRLTAGEAYDVRIEYRDDAPNQCCTLPNVSEGRPGVVARFAWEPPTALASPQIAEAAELARGADVAIVAARTFEGENADRHSLQLPQDQDRLIEAVASANPRTVVALQTGGPVTMPWLDDVPAVLEQWFPGEAQGTALADVLSGRVNPSGRLPMSWPATEDQPSRIGALNPSLQFGEPAPVNDHADQGVFVGYRGYEQHGERPLFPFGHGLSYTRFRYSGLRVRDPRLDSDAAPGRLGWVSLRVRNVGRRAGTEIVQLYHGRLNTRTPTPPKQLLGWSRVTLEPGESRRVTMPVRLGGSEHQLAYWRYGRWHTPTGRVAIAAGASSEDLRLGGTITVRRGATDDELPATGSRR